MKTEDKLDTLEEEIEGKIVDNAIDAVGKESWSVYLSPRKVVKKKCFTPTYLTPMSGDKTSRRDSLDR